MTGVADGPLFDPMFVLLLPALWRTTQSSSSESLSVRSTWAIGNDKKISNEIGKIERIIIVFILTDSPVVVEDGSLGLLHTVDPLLFPFTVCDLILFGESSAIITSVSKNKK